MKKEKRGFTLIELLVVIVIIGILGLVLYTAIDGALNEANKRQKQRLMDKVENGSSSQNREFDQVEVKPLVEYNIGKYRLTLLPIDEISKTSNLLIVSSSHLTEGFQALLIPKDGVK